MNIVWRLSLKRVCHRNSHKLHYCIQRCWNKTCNSTNLMSFCCVLWLTATYRHKDCRLHCIGFKLMEAFCWLKEVTVRICMWNKLLYYICSYTCTIVILGPHTMFTDTLSIEICQSQQVRESAEPIRSISWSTVSHNFHPMHAWWRL